MAKVSGGLYSNERLLTDKLKKVSEAEKSYNKYNDTVLKLEEEERRLLDEIASLEFYKSKCEESKTELITLQDKKDNVLDELEVIKANTEDAVEECKNKIDSYESRYDALEEKAKKHEDMVYQFEQRLIETQDLFKDEEGKLKDVLAKIKVEKEQSSNEQQAIKNLCNNTEDEYIKWEQKVVKAKAKADKEEDRNKKAKENYDKWRIGVLEEVARLKLKNKVGLSEILNNS